MEATDLATSAFWESHTNHIACNPLSPGDADGLDAFARRDLGAKGWCFFQTSGSEGAPKWVGLTKEAFLESARRVNAHFALGSRDVWAVALPLHHVGGFSIAARSFLSGARVAAFSARWDAGEFAAFCERERATVTSLVPAQIFDLVASAARCPVALEKVIVGGGGLSAPLAARALELGWRTCRTYGMTEAASQVAARPSGVDLPEGAMEILPLWETSVDHDHILTIKGPSLARGFATRAADGRWSWSPIDPVAGLRTRDRVELLVAGGRRCLRFLGRDASFVKILGELVSLSALQERVELAAGEAGYDRRLIVIALPDERRDSRLVLVVEGGEGDRALADAVLAAYHERSPPFERIEEVRVMERLPVTAIGKTDLPRLAELLR